MNSNYGNAYNITSYSHITKLLADILMVFVPSIGYFFQAMKFKQTKSTKGFAKFLCLLLLIANILRIFFLVWKKIYFNSFISSYCGGNKSNIFNSCIS